MSPAKAELVRATLRRAIQIEARNGEVYDSLASLFRGYEDSVVKIFEEMAAEERQHGAELEQSYRERFGEVPQDVGEPRELIESPDLEDPEALIFDSMTAEQALETGLRAERQARQFYREQVARTDDPALRQIYCELAAFEEDHVRQLETKLAELRRNKPSQ